jgi:cation transport regulator ChaC
MLVSKMYETNNEKFIYFAYGSNMLNRRINAMERATSAVSIGIGFAQGYKLNFNKESIDKSGKCDIDRLIMQLIKCMVFYFRSIKKIN